MTKAEIANEISKSTGIEKTAVISVIEQFMTVVKDSLAHGENVYLRGFGSFIVKIYRRHVTPVQQYISLDFQSITKVPCQTRLPLSAGI